MPSKWEDVSKMIRGITYFCGEREDLQKFKTIKTDAGLQITTYFQTYFQQYLDGGPESGYLLRCFYTDTETYQDPTYELYSVWKDGDNFTSLKFLEDKTLKVEVIGSDDTELYTENTGAVLRVRVITHRNTP